MWHAQKNFFFFISDSLQLLRILFNELILHEIEHLLIEHATENFISGRSMIQDPKDTYAMTFLNSLGPDFLSKIRQNFSSAAAAANLGVKIRIWKLILRLEELGVGSGNKHW